MRANNIKNTVNFLIKSFEPNYIIHLTHTNKIVTFDEKLIHDFQIKIKDAEEFVGLDFIRLLSRDNRNTLEFRTILSNIIKDYGIGLCAINATFNDCSTSNIPAIYLVWIVVEPKIIGSNSVKEIKIFNYIELARVISNIFGKHMFAPLINLTKLFRHSVQEKSLYFAFESLKSFGTFISSDVTNYTNQQQLADIVHPFHKTKSPQISQRFVSEFLRNDGYVDYDKERQIKVLSLDTLNRVTCRHLIPFNSLDINYIIQLS